MPNCLIVDDSEVIRRVARHILQQLNFNIIEAESGQDGLDHCQESMPDYILLDWDTPSMSGHDFLIALKMIPSRTKPYVIYCTTENNPADISLAIQEGAADYLLKPFDRHSVLDKFAELTAKSA